MTAELPIDFLISLNQGLQEEQRLVAQMRVEAKRIDEELDYRYHRLLDSMIKMGNLTRGVKTKSQSPLVRELSSGYQVPYQEGR
jgi:hypothetical protein